jgi:hypothetical protein
LASTASTTPRACRKNLRRFGRLLEKYPQYQHKVVLTQIAPPTRESVETYSDIRHELESLAGSINGRLGDLDWVPIHYIYRSTPRRRLGDIYRSSRICMVTPLRDGMNLVAKEYVAAQNADDPGVLILSQFASVVPVVPRIPQACAVYQRPVKLAFARVHQNCAGRLAAISDIRAKQNVPGPYKTLVANWRGSPH